MVSISGEELWCWRLLAVSQAVDTTPDRQVQLDYLYDLDWLLTAVSPLDRLTLRLETFRTLSSIELTRSLFELTQLWHQRLEHRVPIQYLLGQTAWRDLILEVAPGVLIPRPETELLIDLAQEWVEQHPILDQHAPMQWADLGTGSGAIALGLAQSFPQADIHAVDLSPTALAIAQRNAKQLQRVKLKPIQFYLGEWLIPLSALRQSFDGIVSNPPYIPSSDVLTLQPEVSRHEPHLALDGGEDGLDSIRYIVDQAPRFLRRGGVLLLEMMRGQSGDVKAILQSSERYSNIQIFTDLSGIERFALATRI
jgi:release factor glutamine methyltransferase